ncbi:MAG: M23 family metallopeptidase [candidate division Zixibacteria bacterium]|nr:M23 family metallopeptidase [candidate division Zixibacteria bacterium]
MWKKKLTLMLIPNSEGTLKQFRMPVALIYGIALVVIFLLFGSFFLSAKFFSNRVDNKELKTLQTENQTLQNKYEQMRWHLAEVESRYEELVQKEIHIRSLFELPEIDLQQRQLGIGGPSFPKPVVRSETETEALNTEAEVDHLLRLSEFELEKYAEVESSLLSIKDRLNHTPSIWPSKGWISRGYGMKPDPFTGIIRMHRGIDIANHIGTPVVAAADGKVVSEGKNGGLGKSVAIDHGYGFVTRYAHLSGYEVKRGEYVKRGDVIGLIGSTGYSTGPHLHYEVIRNHKSINPYKYILNDM